MILGTKANELQQFVGNIPDEQLVIVPNPITGELLRSTFGQLKADVILAVGDLSYLDQIIEVDQVVNLPNPGEVKKIYVITGAGADQNKQFRWGGSIYIEFPAGSGDVAAEAILRGNADAALQQNIDDEIQNRQTADNTLQQNINAEAIFRSNADTNLQQNLNAEINARVNNDSILQGLINAESVSRTNADANLQSQINSIEAGMQFLGKFTSFAALQTAFPTAQPGNYAQVDEGAGYHVVNYNWDAEDGWVQGGSGSSATTTDELPEGATNKYFTASRVLAVALTGLADVADALLPTDTILAAFGKIKKTISDYLSSFNAANKLLKIDSDGKLPALDGSKLTGISAGASDNYAVASGTNNYTATIPGLSSLSAGNTLKIKFTNANTGASTLNPNSIGAISIYKNGSSPVGAGDIPAGAIITLVYGGTNFQIQGMYWVPPVVVSERALTVTSAGVQSEYEVVNAPSASLSDLANATWNNDKCTGVTGYQGQVTSDANYVYVCTNDTGAWDRFKKGFPTVNMGEVVLTVTPAGLQKNYDVVEPIAANLTDLANATWVNDTCSGVVGFITQMTFDANYIYYCYDSAGKWGRIPRGIVAIEIRLSDMDDTAGAKTNAEMELLYPGALIGQEVKGAAGRLYKKEAPAQWIFHNYQNCS